MRLLIDTHVAIWLVMQPDRIPSDILETLATGTNEVFVSVATIWEIAIKHPLKRADSPPFSAADAVREFSAAHLAMLGISADHAAAVERLPAIHSDPFDRMIVAQAQTEPLRLVTHDKTLALYEPSAITF